MLIEDLVKEINANDGTVVRAYVVYSDFNGKLHRKNIFSEDEYRYFEVMFNAQKKRTEELKKLTPKANYTPREYRYALPEVTAKNTHVGKRLISFVAGVVLGVTTTGLAAQFILSRDNPNYTTLTKINSGSFLEDTNDDRFIVRNEQKFTEAARCLFSGDYTDAPEFDGEFIKDYVESCYSAETDGILEGKTDDSRYRFDFKQFMSATDRIAFENKAGSEMFASLLRMYKNPNASEVDSYTYNSKVNKYLDTVLGYILQHLNPEDDEFTKLDPFTRIVIIEQAKAGLRLVKDDYSFFNHAFPTRNQNKDELLEALDKKEIAAVEYLNTTVRMNKGKTLTR